MARALWKGSIAFGLVNIPVELHTAVRDSRLMERLPQSLQTSRAAPRKTARARKNGGRAKKRRAA